MCGIFAFKGESVPREVILRSFGKTVHRGPDKTTYSSIDDVFLGFHRLAIVDLSERGQQPFVDPTYGNALVCNGEIYNNGDLRPGFERSYPFTSSSDCEVLLPMLERYGVEGTVRRLDAEFALVYYEPSSGRLYAARDPVGIRPLFYGTTERTGEIAFASEAKALTDFCSVVAPFPPGHYYDGRGRFVQYRSLSKEIDVYYSSEEGSHRGIRTLLEQAVRKRMIADAPVGFLLSGGLDSSLVCALGSRCVDRPIHTFAVGTDTDAIDIKYAERVAEHLGAHHTNVHFTVEQAVESLRDVIYHLETWDITTIRASIGMYLVCKHIREKTDIKVLLTGEVSDELFGYKYTDFAPSAEAFQQEACKRIDEIHMYDVLRADRCISAHSLEARVPFGDLDFVDFIMAMDPAIKMNRNNIGKYHLRKAFDLPDDEVLPRDILYREKAAFSDAVGHSMRDSIQAFAESRFSDADLAEARLKYPDKTPFTKESLLYRTIFEDLFPGRSAWIKDYWMPNREWENCDVLDPSARALPNYGKSGV